LANQQREPNLAQLGEQRLMPMRGAFGPTLTDTLLRWREFGPNVVPLPHPSPRNIAWFKRNPWFEAEVLPTLRTRVAVALQA
jgi:uracil-DNA glycosylase